ncbi:MAG: TolC family protein [candidate division WOR-3 bacterium]|nr:MAG: TolC family protein [candidate division WOR-3 bacterium]
MKFVFLSCIIPIILLSQISFAQNITMKDFFESVQKTHPFFLKESLTAEIEMKKQERLLGSQDWVIRSSPYYMYQKPVSTGLGYPEEISMVGADIALAKTSWKTGGRLSLALTSEYTDQTIPDIVIPFSPQDIVIPAGPAKLYTSKVYLKYSQPLMQNFGGKLDKLEYELTEYEIDFINIQTLENQEEFVLDLGMRFLEWVLLSEQNRIAQERLALAEEQMKQIERRWTANLVERVDVLRAEDAVRIAKQGIVLIESHWKAKQAELAVLAQVKELYDLGPQFDIYTLQTLPELDDAATHLMETSRVLNALSVRRDQLSHLIEGYREAKRPQLYLSVGAGLQDGDEEIGNSLGFNKPDVFVALDFRYPLGNRTAKADVAKTELELKQLDKDIENIALELEAGARNLVILIKEMEKVLALNQEQVESARTKTKEELRLYNQGRSDLTFVIQSQDNEEIAELTYAENAVAYQKLILQYHALMDELLSQ